MNETTFRLLARITLIVETLDHHSELDAAVRGAGYTDELHNKAEHLMEECEERVLEITSELQHNKTVIHLVHTAATELEMWLQTARFRARKASGNYDLNMLMGGDIHSEDHTVTVVAQALRFTSMVRTDDVLRSHLGSERSVADLLQRGNVLTNKLLRLTEGAITPEKETDLQKANAWLIPLRVNIQDWFQTFEAIAKRAFSNHVEAFGILGMTPADVAVPLGGTASNVTLHEKAQRDTPPKERPAPPAPGWSIGRVQGQNNLNTGKGFVGRVLEGSLDD